MEDKTWTIILAIVSLVVLEICAMFNGINGNMLRFVVVCIAGLGGFVAHDKIEDQLKMVKKKFGVVK